MEIRFLSNYKGEKFNNWNLIRTLGENLSLEYRYNSLFITTYEELKNILLFKIGKYPLTRLYNIFISVNPKRKIMVKTKSGILRKSYYGGIAGTSHIQTILCDIEHIGERAGNATEEMLEECIQGAKYLVKTLKLESFFINISGNGVHLWFDLEEPIELPLPKFTEFADKVKYNLKEPEIYSWIKTYNRFIEKLDKMIKEYNPKLKVDDGAKDISRIARPVGSWNVKAGKTARAVGTVVKLVLINKGINKSFLAAKPLLDKESQVFRKVKAKSSNNRFNALTIQESPLYKLMVSRLLPSTLSRNHYLEQSFARLLRDNDISLNEINELISTIDIVQMKNVQVDPDYLDGEDIFNPETINTYCYACKIEFVYPIMEDTQAITDGFITEKHFNSLNTYSDTTVEKMVAAGFFTPEGFDGSYFSLKSLIRNLIDKHERSTVFFTLKYLLKDDWEYLYSNKIIQQIMNKTRQRHGDN